MKVKTRERKHERGNTREETLERKHERGNKRQETRERKRERKREATREETTRLAAFLINTLPLCLVG